MIRLVLEPQAEATILDHSLESADGLETGGLLLGRGPDESSLLHIEQAGDAGPEAVRERGFFKRDLAHAQSLADRAWDRHQRVWIGEWHTHPHGDPMPSAIDINQYAKHLADSELGFAVFASLIVIPGPEGDWEKAAIARYLFSPAGPEQSNPLNELETDH